MHGEERANGGELGIERRRAAQEGGRQGRLPVVDVQDVGRWIEPPQPLEGRSAEEREPLGVVRVVASRWAVQGVAVEVAVGADEHRRHGGAGHGHDLGRFHAAGDRRMQAERGLGRREPPKHAAVGGQTERHLRAGRDERARQGGEHVAEPTRLGVRVRLRREHRDAHHSGVSRRKRAASSGGTGFTGSPPLHAVSACESVGMISTCQW